MTLVSAAFVLMAVMLVKHFVADYPLQGRYMLRKFSSDPNVWVPALAAHAGVHALFTALVASWALYFSRRILSNGDAWALIALLSALDFSTHFAMDRIKASQRLLGRFNVNQAEFWWALGFDQTVHHLSDLLIVYLLVTAR